MKIRKSVPLDLKGLGGTLGITFVAKKPDGTTATWTATQIEADENRGQFFYTVASGDLDQEGVWVVRPRFLDGHGSPSYDRFGDAFTMVVKGVNET